MIAKNDWAHQQLSAQIKARAVKRHYLALVHGRVKDASGVIDKPIGRHPHDRKKMAVRDQGRQAVTEYSVKEYCGDRYTLVECRLHTGRRHQIRVHLAAVNHPVVGDPFTEESTEIWAASGSCFMPVIWLLTIHAADGWIFTLIYLRIFRRHWPVPAKGIGIRGGVVRLIKSTDHGSGRIRRALTRISHEIIE